VKILGFICQVEIVKALANIPEMSSISAKELMVAPVVTLNINDSVAIAKNVMLNERFSHVPVVQEGRLVGMVTANDLVHTYITPIGTVTTGNRVGDKIPRFTGTLEGIMDSYPLTVGSQASAREVARKLTEHKKSACVMTLADDQVVGIITPRELLKPMMRFRGEGEIPVYIVGLSEVGDFFERAVVEEKIRRIVKRALTIHPHIAEISIKMKSSRTGGSRARYEVAANVHSLATEERFDVSKEGWDLMAVFDQVGDALDRFLRDSKHEPKPLSEEERSIRFSMRMR